MFCSVYFRAKKYTPPFTIIPKILKLLQNVARNVGILEGRRFVDVPLSLRRDNNIKAIVVPCD